MIEDYIAFHSVNNTTAISIKDNTTADEKTISSIARSFYPLKRSYTITKGKAKFPCFLGKMGENKRKRGEDLKGMIYVKLPKASSSTLAGINLRIAHRYGTSMNDVCASNYEHRTGKQLKLSQRNLAFTFLWTFVRHPISYSISRLFFLDVTRNITSTNHTELIKHLRGKKDGNTQFKYLDPFESNLTALNELSSNVKRVIDDYDFIGVVERFDESLVALRLMLGLSAGDIIYVRSKIGGNWDDAFTDHHHCIKTASSFVTPSMKTYYASSLFHAKHETDFLLYEAANRSLDLTITRIGRLRFEEALEEHKYLNSLVDRICAPITIFPCSVNGTSQTRLAKKNCYYYDYGCGYPCLDELFSNYTSGKFS